jgi:GT2 family glycosyltransferase
MPGSIRLCATTFVSALFNRVAVQAVGFPVEEFFIWWDDVEYTGRMSDNGYWGYHVDDSWVTHLTAENKLALYSSVDKTTLWKFQYGIRNEIALLKAKEYGWVRASWRMVSMTLETRRNNVPAHMILRLWFWGLKGWFFNYRRFIVRPQDA